jgi:hypothetical protein
MGPRAGVIHRALQLAGEPSEATSDLLQLHARTL